MIDFDLKTIVNVGNDTFLISTVNLIYKRDGDPDFQTLVVRSESWQDEKLGKFNINYDVIDWNHPIEEYEYKTLDEARRGHFQLVERFRDRQGFCGVR